MDVFNKKLVETFFGYWPKFCDAKLSKFSFDAELRLIKISLHYDDNDSQLTGEVTMAFRGCSFVELSELRIENVIDVLSIEPLGDGFNVCIEGCFGINGVVKCQFIEVEKVDKI